MATTVIIEGVFLVFIIKSQNLFLSVWLSHLYLRFPPNNQYLFEIANIRLRE